MLQVLNQTPNWPIPQQTNQSTDFTTELSFLDEPWGPTPTTLPSIASAFIPRASSPGQFSTASSTRSEAQEWMDLDAPAPSPNPSDISDAPSFEDLSEIIFDDIRRSIFDVCQEINISPDPSQWSIEEVDKWIKRSNAHYNLQPINMDFFHIDGVSLCNLTEDDFRQRAPRGGDVIFHDLEVWKSVAAQPFQRPQPAPAPQPMQEEAFFLPNTFPIPQPFPMPQEIPTPNFTYNIKMEPQDDIETASIASGSSSDDQSLPSPTTAGSGPDTSMTPNHTGSIHLWQFLKELLLQPDSYSYCIRWLDRSQGIFKIEDSVKVANLWGRRKNRPAMNYDKMSRSIRQYYKKGIMKKTEVSQRLVYQFVNPC